MSKGNDGVVKPEDRAGMCDLCRCAFVTGVIVVNNDTEQINIFFKKEGVQMATMHNSKIQSGLPKVHTGSVAPGHSSQRCNLDLGLPDGTHSGIAILSTLTSVTLLRVCVLVCM